ncbi:DUF397 domain-containing protein [Micromonospora peucetia]|uniref:DUF397 domain-containing protein n=1 Tax=Micromonospora peucetia TaxID=47871 RepID=UPI00332E3B85
MSVAAGDGTGTAGGRRRAAGDNGGDCGDNLPGVVAVRDSKDPAGPTLAFAPAAWRAFVDSVAERP